MKLDPKHASIPLVALAGALALGACGGDDESTGTSAETTETAASKAATDLPQGSEHCRATARLHGRDLLFEEHGDALAACDAVNGLAEQTGDRHDLDLRRKLRRLGLHAVGHEQPLDRAALEPFARCTGE